MLAGFILRFKMPITLGRSPTWARPARRGIIMPRLGLKIPHYRHVTYKLIDGTHMRQVLASAFMASLLGVLFTHLAWARIPSLDAPTPGSAYPLQGAMVAIDEENRWQASDLLTMDASIPWRPLGSGEAILPYSDKAHWLIWRTEIGAASAGQMLILLATYTKSASLYVFDSLGRHVSQTDWSLADPLHTLLPSFSLPVQPGSYTLLLRLASPYLLSLAAVVGNMQLNLRWTSELMAFASAYLALVVLLCAYHCALYVTLKNRIFLAYLAFIAPMGLVELSISGLADYYLPLPDGWTWLAAAYVLRCLPAIGILWFAYELLELKFRRFWTKMFLTMGGVNTMATLLVIGIGPSALTLSDAINGATLLCLFGAGVSSLKSGHKLAKIYLLALLAMAMGVAFWTLGNYGAIERSFLTEQAPVIGNVVEVLLLTYGVALHLENLRHIAEQARLARYQGKLKDRMLRVLSHDLANPLAIIKGRMDLVQAAINQGQWTPAPKVVEGFWLSSQKAVNNMMVLLQRSRELLTTGQESLELVPVHVQSLLEDCQHDFEARAQAKGIHIVIKVDDGQVSVRADAHALKSQVLANFLSNAIKFAPEGSSIVLSCQRRYGRTLIGVSDEGEGISQDNINKISRARQLASTPGTQGEAGTGFGLALAYEYAEVLGATIEIDTTKHKGGTRDRGTSFTLVF